MSKAMVVLDLKRVTLLSANFVLMSIHLINFLIPSVFLAAVDLFKFELEEAID